MSNYCHLASLDARPIIDLDQAVEQQTAFQIIFNREKIPMTSESETTFRYSQASALADRLDNTVLVSGLLSSPLLSFATSTTIINNPTLRVVTMSACMVDLAALATSTAFRLRLKFLSYKGKDEQFAKNISGSWPDRCLATSTPMVLIVTAMVLFLGVVTGSSVSAHSKMSANLTFSTAEMLVVGAGGILALAHCGLVFRSIVNLGRL